MLVIASFVDAVDARSAREPDALGSVMMATTVTQALMTGGCFCVTVYTGSYYREW